MMAQQMKLMPSLPTLGSALCHIFTLAVVMQKHTDLSIAPGAVGASHHNLESTGEPPLDRSAGVDPLTFDGLLQMVARLEEAIDTHEARLTTAEKHNADLTAILNERMDGHEGTAHGTREGSRRMQSDGGTLHPHNDDHAEPVYILKPNVIHVVPGSVDGDSDHRRAQAGDGYGEGICLDLESRSAEVTLVCCDEPEEDCTDGLPHTCNAGCAATFLPFWQDCQATLGKGSRQFEPVVALCSASAAASRPSFAEQLNLECTDVEDCVPECSERYHGYLMLLNINGRDSKLSCELHRGHYSWVGAAADGGYLGADVDTFTSSITSAAPGRFIVVLMNDAGILADLVIQRNQEVTISGDPSLRAAPMWGTGAFVLQQHASLSLRFVGLEGAITLQQGATALTLCDCVNTNIMTARGLDIPSGAVVAFNFTAPTNLVIGTASMAGHLAIYGPVTLSNANVIAIAADIAAASGNASVTLGGGVRCYLPNKLVPVLSGSIPGTLNAMVDGQTVGNLSTSGATVSSVPLGWYDADPEMWDSGDIVNSNGNTFSLYLLPLQPPNAFVSATQTCADGVVSTDGARTYADLCAAAGLRPIVDPVSTAATHCSALNCMPILVYHPPNVIRHYFADITSWGDLKDDAVWLATTEPQNPSWVSGRTCVGLGKVDSLWFLGEGGLNLPLRPLCGLEHVSVVGGDPGRGSSLEHVSVGGVDPGRGSNLEPCCSSRLFNSDCDCDDNDECTLFGHGVDWCDANQPGWDATCDRMC